MKKTKKTYWAVTGDGQIYEAFTERQTAIRWKNQAAEQAVRISGNSYEKSRFKVIPVHITPAPLKRPRKH